MRSVLVTLPPVPVPVCIPRASAPKPVPILIAPVGGIFGIVGGTLTLPLVAGVEPAGAVLGAAETDAPSDGITGLGEEEGNGAPSGVTVALLPGE
jgi:hypothetical protein